MERRIEVWADSFHEGRWVAQEIASRLPSSPIRYDHGYVPAFDVSFDGNELHVVVRGDYQAWTPQPEPIRSLLQYGKPDFVVYSPDTESVLFAGEETAAVPTGNQSTQRCERMVGACLQEHAIPFVYLLPEYGLHLDGQVRRASVWPAMLAAKLSDQYTTNVLVLTFGDRTHPEDYSVGRGPGLMFDLICTYVQEHMELPGDQWRPQRDTASAEAKRLMLAFVKDQAPSMLKVLPPYADDRTQDQSLDWPVAKDINDDRAFVTPELQRPDQFLAGIYDAVRQRTAYTLVPGAGSKPQPLSNVRRYRDEHVRAVATHKVRPAGYEAYDVDLDTFPRSSSGNYHLTASHDITFLMDDGADLVASFRQAFDRPQRMQTRLNNIVEDKPVFLYTAASMKKGRVFGDPYSGQLSCFSKLIAFDHANRRTRLVVAYFPLQSYAIFPERSSDWNRSKGLRLYQHLVDVVICHGGVLVLPATKEIL